MLIRKGREDVTVKEAYVFLGQVRGYENKIKRLERSIESLKYNLLPGAVRYDKDRVNTSPEDSMTELFARIDEYERALDVERRQRAEAVLKVDDALSKMSDTKEKIVLMEYYIGRISISDIASGLGITVRHCIRLKNNGVCMFAEVMSDDKRS